MDENKGSIGFLSELALMADKIQVSLKAKTTVVFEVEESIFNSLFFEFNGSAPTTDQFRIDISGTNFIFLKDMS